MTLDLSSGLDLRVLSLGPQLSSTLSVELTLFLFFLKILFISQETHTEKQRHRQREKQAPCREPDVGLDPGSLGSRPGPKAGSKLGGRPPRDPLKLTLKIKTAQSLRDRTKVWTHSNSLSCAAV